MISMNRSHKRKLLVSVIGNAMLSILVLMQSLVFQLSQPDTVLCIGDNGHITLEQKGTDKHCNHPSDPFLFDQLAGNDFHEDDCMDISLEQHLESADKKHEDIQRKSSGNRSYRVDVIHPLSTGIKNQINRRNNIFPPELDALKGIVLLI